MNPPKFSEQIDFKKQRIQNKRMPKTFICDEIPNKRGPYRVHEISVPDDNEPRARSTAVALEKFGKCSHGPVARYLITEKQYWLDERQRHAEVSKNLGGGNMLNLYEGGTDPKVTTAEQLPKTQHASLKAFFEHIGFDPKTRRYSEKSRDSPHTPEIS